ncbi:hypothetical protein Tco_1059465 [Tanacetum coccineum]
MSETIIPSEPHLNYATTPRNPAIRYSPADRLLSPDAHRYTDFTTYVSIFVFHGERNDESNIPGTRIEPRSDKESPEVEIAKEKEKGEREEGNRRTRNSPIPTPIRSLGFITNLGIFGYLRTLGIERNSSYTSSSKFYPYKKVTKMIACYHTLFKTKLLRFQMLQELLSTRLDITHYRRLKHVKKQVMQQVPEQVRNQVPVYVAEGLILERQKAKEETERLIAKAILQERGNIQAQILTQIENAIANVIPSQVDASVRNYYMKFERNTVLQTACRTPAVRPRDQDDPHDDAHPLTGVITDSYASDDDEIPTNQVSQDIMEEVSLTIDEAKLRKMDDEMLRHRCTSGDEHQYHIDQKENSGLRMIVLSLHEFQQLSSNDDDIDERNF